MIRCTLELIPGGFGEPERLGVIEIDNQIVTSVRSGGRRGDYRYKLQKKRKGAIVNVGVIGDFPRLSYHPWNLIKRILDECALTNGGRI